MPVVENRRLVVAADRRRLHLYLESGFLRRSLEEACHLHLHLGFTLAHKVTVYLSGAFVRHESLSRSEIFPRTEPFRLSAVLLRQRLQPLPSLFGLGLRSRFVPGALLCLLPQCQVIVLGKLPQNHLRLIAECANHPVVCLLLIPSRSFQPGLVPQSVGKRLLLAHALRRAIHDVPQHIRRGNVRREKRLAVFLGKLYIPHIRRRVVLVL